MVNKVFSPSLFQGEGRGEGNSLPFLLFNQSSPGAMRSRCCGGTHVRIARDERQRPYRYLL